MSKKALMGSLLLAALIQCFAAVAQDLGDPNCDHLVLVSGFNNANVRIYDGCSGEYIRDLDDPGGIPGAQAIIELPNGDLAVASERSGQIRQFDRETLTFDKVLVQAGGAPTGVAVTPEGRLFVGDFNQNTIIEYTLEGAAVSALLPTGTTGLAGPDAGMIIKDNALFIPAFNSSVLLKMGLAAGATPELLVSSGGGGLNAPRTILLAPNGNLFVSNWRGNNILEFDPNSGALVREVSNETFRPSGIAFESDQVLLVASDQVPNIRRIRISDGVNLGDFIPAATSGLNGATFIYRLKKQSVTQAADLSTVRQFWLVGVGTVAGSVITVDEMLFTTAGAFGTGLDPAAIGREPWGSLEIDFTGCNQADFSYTPLPAYQPTFDGTGYPISRLAASPLGDACVATGFSLVTDNNWMSGHWYGGASRSGEGMNVDLINNDQAIVTWYSYLPEEAGG